MAFNAIIILHFFLGGLFTYLFLRDLGVHSTGALISGLIFMLSGYLLSVHSLLTCLLSVIWTPLIMMFFRRAMSCPGFKNEIVTSIFMAISFLGGGVEIVYGNFLVLLSMIIFSPQIQGIQEGDRRGAPLQNKNSVGEPPSVPACGRQGLPKWAAAVGRPYWNRFRSLLIVSTVFLFLSAIQFIPFLELWVHSIRGKGISYQEATVWSFAPKDILLFFLPDVYGYFIDMKKYWINQCWFKTLYTGGLPFILSSLFFLFGKGRRLFFSLMIFSLFLSLGQYNPFYPFVFKYVPFFNGIRYPAKFLYIFILILSITAGLGFEKLTGFSKESARRGLKHLSIILALVSGLALLILVLGHQKIEHLLRGKGLDVPDFNFLSINLYHAKRFVFYLTLFFLLLRIGHEVQWKGWAKVLLILFLIADLFGNMGFYGKERTSEYFQKTKVQEIIASDIGHFRVFATGKTIAAEIPILVGGGSPLDVFKEKHEPTMNLLHWLRDIWGIDVVHLKRADDLYKAFVGTPSISATNLIDLYGVKYVTSVTLIEKDPRFEMIYSRLEGLQGKREDLLKENTIKLYRNRNPLPRAWLVRDHRVLDEKSILAILSGKEFNPRKEVLLEEEPGVNPPRPPLVKGRKERGLAGQENKKGDRGESPLQKKKDVGEPRPAPACGRQGLPELISEGNNRLQLLVEAKEDSLLVLSDTYFPGWKAYLDGSPVRIFRANYNFRAVSIPPGKHEVKFVYHPMSVKLGVLVTSLGIIGILVMGLSSRFKRRVFPPVC